jgi:hypothetical protein
MYRGEERRRMRRGKRRDEGIRGGRTLRLGKGRQKYTREGKKELENRAKRSSNWRRWRDLSNVLCRSCFQN